MAVGCGAKLVLFGEILNSEGDVFHVVEWWPLYPEIITLVYCRGRSEPSRAPAPARNPDRAHQ